jgi:SAM-dependent methyltransferase
MDDPVFDVAENHAFWKRCSPEGYLHAGAARGEALIELLKELKVDQQASILELGCNCGRNLDQLWGAGYHHLHGVEINPKAVRYFDANYGDPLRLLRIIQEHPHGHPIVFKVLCGSIESYTKDQAESGRTFDVIFTMAVLFHMHPDSEWCFANIAKLTGKYLILIECETSHVPPRHYRRCYKTIFENLGLRELFHRKGFGDLTNKYTLRVFEVAQ